MTPNTGIVKDDLGSVVNNSTENDTLEEKVYESEVSKDITFLVFNESYAAPLKKSHPENTIIILKGGKEFDIEFNYAGITGVVYMQTTYEDKLEKIANELKKNECLVSIIALHKDGGIAECKEYIYPIEVTPPKQEPKDNAVLNGEEPLSELELLKAKWLVDSNEVRLRGPVQWNLKGLLPKNSMGYIYGGRGSFKSFIALDIASAVVRGQNWRGYKNKTGKGRVLYIVAEGHAGFPARLEALKTKYGHWDVGTLVCIERPVNMSTEKDVSEILLATDHINNPFTVVIIDTLSRVSGGVDKNSNQIMLVLEQVDRFKTPKTTVIILAHPPKGNGSTISGAFDQEGAADFMLNVIRDKDQGSKRTKVIVQKQKDGEDGIEFDITLQRTLVAEATEVGEEDDYALVLIDDYIEPSDLPNIGKILREIELYGPITQSDLSKRLCNAGVEGCDKGGLSKKLNKDKAPDVLPKNKVKEDYCSTSIKAYVSAMTTKHGNLTHYSLNPKGTEFLMLLKKEANWPTTITTEVDKETQENAAQL